VSNKLKSFVWDIPCYLRKSDEDDSWVIEGIASTAHRDEQGEIVDQTGLDISHLIARKGYFNEDHKPGVEHKVGKITQAKKTDSGLYVKGYLFKKSPKAKAFHGIMSSLQKGDEKSVKMSIEGKIVKRAQGNRIAQAKVTGVALTLNPVNENTYAKFIKSLKEQGFSDSDDFGVLEHGGQADTLESAFADCTVEDLVVPSSATDLPLLNEIDEKYALVNKVKLAKALKLAKSKYEDDNKEEVEKGMGVGDYNQPPGELKGSAAYSKESLDKKKKEIKGNKNKQKKFTKLVRKLRKSYPNMDPNKLIDLSCIIFEDRLFRSEEDKAK